MASLLSLVKLSDLRVANYATTVMTKLMFCTLGVVSADSDGKGSCAEPGDWPEAPQFLFGQGGSAVCGVVGESRASGDCSGIPVPHARG